MAREVVPYVNEQAWLAERLRDVTSTEVAALFDASPWITCFELYHAKRERVVEARADNDRMRWGRRLQDPIAHGVAEDQGLDVRRMNEYIRNPEARLGASFDFEITGARGRGDKTAI